MSTTARKTSKRAVRRRRREVTDRALTIQIIGAIVAGFQKGFHIGIEQAANAANNAAYTNPKTRAYRTRIADAVRALHSELPLPPLG